MSKLPNKRELPIQALAACFNNTSATYKFYWFLAIIQALEKGETRISKKHLFGSMIANAWYTVNYFHVSFGKQDKLQRAIEYIGQSEGLTIDVPLQKILGVLNKTTHKGTIAQLNYFDQQVPHRFLTPWFPGMNKNDIYTASIQFRNNCLYALYKHEVVINPTWKGYLLENAGILKDFCYWNLAMYLQVKNPNVPDIPNKLKKPASRNSLTKQRKQFWDLVMKELGRVRCIYTGNLITADNYVLEHFLPYAFVSHDLIWNLIPADRDYNSSKSDKLPRLDVYFDSFFKLQSAAVKIVKRQSPNNKFLEDYLSIFPDTDKGFTKERFKNVIQPLITIALNNGFQYK